MEKEVSEVDRKLALKRKELEKIDYYLTRNPINQDELFVFVRNFFAEYLKLDYEFTYEELSAELNKVFIRPQIKDKIDNFLIRLSECEYLENSLGTNEINGFLRELDDLIKNMIYEETVVEAEPSIIKKLFNVKDKEAKKTMSVPNLNSAIEELNFHVSSGHVDVAKKLYIDVLSSYDALSKEEKSKISANVNSAYERLQKLIKNPGSIVDEKPSDSIKRINELAQITSSFIAANNFESAKKNYSELLKTYESLNGEDKKRVHSQVNDLYLRLENDKINETEKLKITIQEEKIVLPKMESANVVSNNTATEPKTSEKISNNLTELELKNIDSNILLSIPPKIGKNVENQSQILISEAKANFQTLKTTEESLINNSFAQNKSEATKVSTKIDEQTVSNKINTLIKKIDDDLISERFDAAQKSYVEALNLYKSMTNIDKLSCFKSLNNAYKKLDSQMHKQKLGDLLDSHLSQSDKTNISVNTVNIGTGENVSNFLPIVSNTDVNREKIYELIEQAYFHVSNSQTDLATLKYFKALELYREASIDDKKDVYPKIYRLFKTLNSETSK